jgi:hypothetical protein
VIEADQPDRNVFDRGDYYRTALTLMGEPTYQQRLHMDIHGEAQPVKRRPMRGKAAESNDLPELKAAAKEAMPRHGVQVVIIDEAHQMLSGGSGANGATLQEQLEWLKSLSSTAQIIHILVGTYDLLNAGKLNGQIGRRCLPVHFRAIGSNRKQIVWSSSRPWSRCWNTCRCAVMWKRLSDHIGCISTRAVLALSGS